MSTDHVQAITCVKNNFSLLTHNCVKNGVHFPNKIVQLWTVLSVACVSSIRSLQDHANFELRTATFGNLQKLSEPLRESSATNVWTLVLLCSEVVIACVAGGIVCTKFERRSRDAAHGGSATKTLPSQTIPPATQAKVVTIFEKIRLISIWKSPAFDFRKVGRYTVLYLIFFP